MKKEKNADKAQTNMDDIISLAKRRGFIYQGSEIYGGLSGFWDFGPFGVLLRNNIVNSWRKKFIYDRFDMFEVDAAILMNPKAWEASGHVGGFQDPLVEDLKNKRRYRADHLLKEAGVDVTGMSLEDMKNAFVEKDIKSPDGNPLSEPKQFNMMLKTNVGATSGDESVSYLRPETAQGMFVNFKNVVDSFHPKLPFGLAQVGKAFRNEIAPRDYIFRVREFEQMEVEYFVKPDDWQRAFDEWKDTMVSWMEEIGLDSKKIHEYEVPKEDLAHYSKRTVDFQFEYPFGQEELYGLAYRTDHDLKSHEKFSKIPLSYFDEETKERFTPHCIEPSLGVGRTILAMLLSCYTEDEINGEKRVYLKFKPKIAPIKIAVFPLMENKSELVEKAKDIYKDLKTEFMNVLFDDNGNVGKRYRRQDEIGTPFCVTVDYDTLEDNTVTVRDRDSGKQERVKVDELKKYITEKIEED